MHFKEIEGIEIGESGFGDAKTSVTFLGGGGGAYPLA